MGIAEIALGLVLFLNIHSPAASSPRVDENKRYPWVSFCEGKASWIDESGKEHPIKKNTIFLKRAQIKTESHSKLRIELNENSNLTILNDSEVLFPVIGWENGKIEKIDLKEGGVAYDCHGSCEVHIDNSISQNVFGVGKYILSYEPQVPRVKLAVIEGYSPFRGLSNEKGTELQAGEEAQFNGVFEGGEIAFDTLLHGRKIAKGQLEPKKTIEKKEFEKLKDAFVDKKKIKKAAMVVVKRTEKQICEKPFGEFNQCAWLRKGKSCLRVRCNANGEWADQRELQPTDKRCGSIAKAQKAVVQACDD